MARKLASIVEIGTIDSIPNADRLESVTPKGKGWHIVTQKGEFKVGDLAVLFEIDSFLDPKDERYEFLKERCLRKFVSKGGAVLREGIRINSIKLRGIVSQGLLMPLDKFPEITSRIVPDPNSICLPNVFDRVTIEQSCPLVGADVTSLLHVEHYDEVKEQLQPAMGNPMASDAMGSFPSILGPKTDEERIQNLGDWFDTMKGRKWEVTCKHDGTSCSIAYAPSVDMENPFIVCSRNLRLKRETASGIKPVYWQMAEKYNVLDMLERVYNSSGKELMLQGEVVGPGINADRNKEKEFAFLCFRIWDVNEQRWLNPNERVAFCKRYNIPHVEIVASDFPFFDKVTTMEAALKFAEGKTAAGNEREGVVLKTCDDGPFASFKIVSNKYLLKQED